MKNFLKHLWNGFITTVAILCVVVVLWCFFTMATALLLLLSPILFVVTTHYAYKIRSFIDQSEDFLGELEELLDTGENDDTKTDS